jgi:hypothetical protein
MFGALICYVINASPETPRLCKMLDGIARQMVKDRPLKEMRFHVENILPNVQRLLESRDDLIPLSKFVPVDPSTSSRSSRTLLRDDTSEPERSDSVSADG